MTMCVCAQEEVKDSPKLGRRTCEVARIDGTTVEGGRQRMEAERWNAKRPVDAPLGLPVESATAAGVVQWQNGSFPSFIRGFDSLHPLHQGVQSDPGASEPCSLE